MVKEVDIPFLVHTLASSFDRRSFGFIVSFLSSYARFLLSSNYTTQNMSPHFVVLVYFNSLSILCTALQFSLFLSPFSFRHSIYQDTRLL
jgi:hypothetical protein